jgi:hypothetical protein
MSGKKKIWELLPSEDPKTISEAEKILKDYFLASLKQGDKFFPGPKFAGSQFDTLDGGGERTEVANQITPSDLVAVTMLSVEVKPQTALKILGPEEGRIAELLSRIPVSVDLVDVDFHDQRYSYMNPETGEAYEVWRLLTSFRGISWVIAGKLMARKRPRLIPVYDRVVRDEIIRVEGHKPDSYWQWLQARLAKDDKALHRQLIQLKESAQLSESISPLRVFDVLVWKQGVGK